MPYSLRPSTRPSTRPPTRPSSPSRSHAQPPPLPPSDDSFSSALQDALHHAAAATASSSASSSSAPAPAPAYPPEEMYPREKGEKPHSTLEILVNQETMVLKGTGVDVDPAVLSGNVVLHLAERMSIREINLVFRGKARVPAQAHESLSLNSHQQTFVVCNHEWSFLEGNKHHSHTLKAGTHFFPFSVQLGGSLPSSLGTPALGGASVAYKLRATAVRPGLAHNLAAEARVHVARAFAPDALEYQQTLEIENTWPEKLMYAIVLPHKAWAVGDNVTALMKFQPLAKGARVLSVGTAVHETIKVSAKGGAPESTRALVSVRHEIHGKRAVLVEDSSAPRSRMGTQGAKSRPTTPGHSPHPSTSGYFPAPPVRPSTDGTSSSGSPASHSQPITSASDVAPSTPPVADPSTSTSPPRTSTTTMLAGAQDLQLPPELSHDPEPSETIVALSIALPPSAGFVPTHSLEPITASHRIRWSILIGNLDGHTSELRCSLPIHLLDGRLLAQARAATRETRRLLLGADAEGSLTTPGGNNDEEEDEEMALPSYTAHVRDRVANMYVDDAATLRMASAPRTPRTGGSSGGPGSPNPHVPLALPLVPGQLPAHPPPEATPSALEWVNSELLLSLDARERAVAAAAAAEQERRRRNRSTPPDSDPASRTGSARASRRGSRAPSPERPAALSLSHPPPPHEPTSAASSTGTGGVPSPLLPPQPVSAPAHEATYVHAGSSASRSSPGLFSASMRPLASSLASSLANARAHSHGNLASHFSLSSHHHHHPSPGHATPPRRGATGPASAPHTPRADVYSEVPDYASSSRGFLGGVPPLSSLSGLPSYEDSEHHQTHPQSPDADLAARMGRQATVSH